MKKIFEKFILVSLMAFFIASLLWWRLRALPELEIAQAGRDGAEGRTVESELVKIGEFFKKYSELSQEEKNAKFPDWPGFRGGVSNLVKSADELDFDLENAAVKWRIPLGEGYAAPVIWKNKIYVLDYDEKEEADSLRCFSLSDARELWSRSYKVKIRRNHGKSRSIPAIAENTVVSIGPMGQVMCVDAESGDLLWAKDLVLDYGSEIPQWYSGQCPIIVDGEAIIAVAGKDVLMMGLDLRTGAVKWSVPNTGGVKLSHSSVMEFELLGSRQFVYCAIGGIFGVASSGEEKGKLLWSNSKWKPNVFAPSPVKITDNKVFLTAGYGAGGAILELSKDSVNWSSQIVKSWKAKTGVACEQQTPLVSDGKLFSILPKDAGGMNSLMVACDVSNDCEIVATSPRETRFGIGPYILINGKIFVLDDNGKLYVLNFDGKDFSIESGKKILSGGDSWGPMAFSGGLLLLRDSVELACLDLRKEKTK